MSKNTKKIKSLFSKTTTTEPSPAPAPISAAVQAPVPPALQRQHKSNRIILELVRPGATNVCVAGSFNDWKPEQTPLVPAGNGRWIGNLAVRPGRHEYLFVVDGQWLPDPNAREVVPNPFGGKNSVLIVSD